MQRSAVYQVLKLQPEFCRVLAEPVASQSNLWVNLESRPIPEAYVGIGVVPRGIVVSIDVGWRILFILAISWRKHVAVLVIEPAKPSSRAGVDVLILDPRIETKLENRAGKDAPREDRIVSACSVYLW